jgi:glycosyltransferase involved in cell wall biosynthesis
VLDLITPSLAHDTLELRTVPDSPRAPSLLAITSQVPWPLTSGGHLRSFHLLRSLARRFRIRLVTTITPGQETAVAALRQQQIEVRPVVLGEPFRLLRDVCCAATAALRGEPYVFYHRHDRRTVRAALRELLQQEIPDVLYLDHLDSLVYRSLAPHTPAVIDLHNVYSTLARRTGEEQRRRLLRYYLQREARLLERMEQRAAQTVDAVLTVSEEDARHLQALGPRSLHLVPNGVDCAAYASLPTGRDAARPLILYVGAMSWGPNVAAAEFLAKEMLPRVRAVIPEACVRIVGRDPGPEVTALRQRAGVEVTGGVADVMPHLREARLLAVPLFSGGGTRLKILEAFAAGLPVVSTPVGCEGLRAIDGEHLVIAGHDRFADVVTALLGDPARARRLAEQGRELVRQQYDWERVGAAACAAVAEVHARRGAR